MIGDILDGKYRIDRQLGAGGMGNVYSAIHLGTTRVVALKVIAPKWAAEPHFLGRFQREARACGRLRHPNIVNVTDFGIANARGVDLPYLVMELLDGETLSAYQQTHPRLPLPLVADLLDQIGLALNEAHRHGIVHRDLKPDNIWLEPNGRGGHTVKVLDFGVAKMNLLADLTPESTLQVDSAKLASDNGEIAWIEKRETLPVTSQSRADETETVVLATTPYDRSSEASWSDASGQTMPGSLIGTPAYMSPEQALGTEIDFRSDIYSLAVVAYSLVCGRLPFTGTSETFLEYHLTGSPPPPKSIAKIPTDVSSAILAGLARDRADRPPSALGLTHRFRNAVDAEYLALQKSKAFLLQHLMTYFLVVAPIYTILILLAVALTSFNKYLLPTLTLQMLLVPMAGACLFIFFDNVLRAAAALIAMDERVRVRRFVSFRVLWQLTRAIPVLAFTQVRSWFLFGPGWVIGDCLWPVICTAEGLSGKAALRRSRELMTGLRSAGRALAIRHLALAVLVLSDMIMAFGSLWRTGHVSRPEVVVKATFFPFFALLAAAPLLLYDRTTAQHNDPLLRLDRTPEAPITSRPFSVSSILWLTAGLIYFLYRPILQWLFGGL